MLAKTSRVRYADDGESMDGIIAERHRPPFPLRHARACHVTPPRYDTIFPLFMTNMTMWDGPLMKAMDGYKEGSMKNVLQSLPSLASIDEIIKLR